MNTLLKTPTDSEKASFKKLFEQNKQLLAPKIKQVKLGYVVKEEKKLIAQGYEKTLAKTIVESRMKHILLPHDILYFDSGKTVTVKEVMANSEKYDGKSLSDPLEREKGNNKAKFYANKDTRNPKIHSFVHGGIVYDLVSDTYLKLYEKHKKQIELQMDLSGDLKKLSKEIINNVESIFSESSLCINWESFQQSYEQSFIDQSKSKVRAINSKGDLPSFTINEFTGNIRQNMFGGFVFYSDLFALIQKHYNNEKEVNKTVSSIIASINKDYSNHLKIYRQRSALRYKTDMFASQPSLTIEPDSVLLTSVHQHFSEGEIDDEIVKDYKQHFPGLDNFILLVVASRFASDRKKAFFWLKAVSDWGKGFLASIFKELGILTEISVTEIEAALSGKPIGRQPTDFKHSWILWIDEFKKVNSEVKQLTSSINASPKNQMVFEAELFMKLFTSAEEVESLAGNGVETQFSNRFSLIETNDASLEERKLFRKKGKALYFSSVKFYIAFELNKLVYKYIELGQIAGANSADKFLEDYNYSHKLSKYYGSLDSVITDITDELRKKILEIEPDHFKILIPEKSLYNSIAINIKNVQYKKSSYVLVKNLDKIISDYIEANVSKSEKAKISYKKTTIKKMLDDSNRSNINAPVRVVLEGETSAKQQKGILVKKK